jgi:nucleoside-diphosphate-sugar epimerase
MQNQSPSVLLVGCGKLGSRLGEALVESGHRVFAIRRNIKALPPTFTGIAVDYRRPVAVELPAMESMVITLTPGASEGGSADLVSPLRWLASALPARPRRVILVSSTGVFDGDPGIRMITEDDVPRPSGPRSQALLDSEVEARRLFDAIVVRPAGIYGPGREYLIRSVARKTPLDHRRRTNRIHESDLVRALTELVRMPAPPRTLHAVDGHPATRGEVVAHIAQRLSVPAPPALSTEPSGHILSGERLRALLGELRYPDYRSGYDDIIAGHDVQHWRATDDRTPER